MHLQNVLDETGYPNEIELAQRRGVSWYGFLFVTQRARGRFVNVRPGGIEEVLQDDLKDKVKPGKLEDAARKRVFEELGK